MSSLDTYVIRKPKPLRYALLALLVMAMTLAACWYISQQNEHQYQQELVTIQQQYDQLKDQHEQLKLQVGERRANFTNQQHELTLQAATSEQLQLQIADLQTKVVELEQELVFYQNITQGNSTSQLQIRELSLRNDSERSDIVHFRLVVTQGQKISNPITGVIKMTLIGLENDKPNEISLGEHQLNLRHVQVIEGQIKIADTIKPQKIAVKLTQKKKVTASKVFDWQIAHDY